MSTIREALDALADAFEEALAHVGTLEIEEPDEPTAPTGKRGKKPTATMEQVREALITLKAEHEMAAVIDVLSRFGVTKIGDLPPEHFAEAITLAEEYEAAEEPADDVDPLGEDEPPEEQEPPKRRRKTK